MADDGLVLNFSTTEGSLPAARAAPKYRGGSWRERIRLQKNAKSRAQGTNADNNKLPSDAAYIRATRNAGDPSQKDFPNSRPQKRRKLDDDAQPNAQSSSKTSTAAQTGPRKHVGNREVISSLFSFNPQPKELEEAPSNEEDNPVKPSNAPLPDGIDTFTTLGLSTTVAAHLLTKMELKNPTAIQKAAVTQLLKEDSDAFIQSETGSGKTLAYLLPVVQRIVGMTEMSKGTGQGHDRAALNRDSGLFAIVLAPTRELCKQISVVLERLLGCAHYIVAGTVIGGEKKKSEKARLRKGINILVATPGRLVDHLENTKTLDVSNVRYLVLDEGDRLMDLGFEDDITTIVKTLDGKKRKSGRPGLPERRVTVLCSATLKMNVQKLGDISLKDAVLVKGGPDDDDGDDATPRDGAGESNFLAPAQLKQSYVVVAAKLRLVTLTALLRRTFARKGSVMKAIVFISCADSVDFHFQTFARQSLATPPDTESDRDSGAESKERSQSIPESLADAISSSPLLSSSSNPLTIYRLHGSLPQGTRTAIVKAFAASNQASLLFATDVASRGLDLPNLDLVIEYDPAFSTDEHLHRIGRTARLGRDGRAMIFLQPGKEEEYVDVLKQSFKKDITSASNVTSQSADDILRKGFTPTSGVVSGSSKEWESKATNYQLDVERWVLNDPKIKEAARKAYMSHIRAYATHVANERKYFDIKELHLGHLAKAFGLRDPPGKVNVQGLRSTNSNSNTNTNTSNTTASRRGKSTQKDALDANSTVVSKKRRAFEPDEGAAKEALQQARNAKADVDETRDAEDAAQKMRELVRNRKKMMGAGADEFNIA